MTSIATPFESPYRRLARAKKNISRLEKRIATFGKTHPGSLIAETDADGITTHAYKFSRKIPDSWADSAVEAIEALRSALDQCGYAVAVLSGVSDPKNAYFPFGDSAAELDANVKGRCKDLPPEISALFRSFDSHEEGNYPLWALNKLCNANKHRLLIPVGLVTNAATFEMSLSGDGSHFELPSPTFDPIKNQIVLVKTGPQNNFKYQIELTVLITFDEFNGVKSSSVPSVLNAIAREVDRVLRTTEAECRRVGLI